MSHTHFLHPGEILKLDYLEGFGLTVGGAAKAMNMTRARLNEIVNGRRGISADTAIRLGRYFGNSPQFWLNLQTHYDLAEAEAAGVEGLKQIKPIQAVERTDME